MKKRDRPSLVINNVMEEPDDTETPLHRRKSSITNGLKMPIQKMDKISKEKKSFSQQFIIDDDTRPPNRN